MMVAGSGLIPGAFAELQVADEKEKTVISLQIFLSGQYGACRGQ